MENIITWNKRKDYLFDFLYQIEHVNSKYIPNVHNSSSFAFQAVYFPAK